MNRSGGKIWMQWFLIAAILFSGCGPPITTRLVTIELERPSEADVQSIRTIGVIPFDSPDPDVGEKIAAEMAEGLDSGVLRQGPFVARVIRPPADFRPEAESIRKLGQKEQVDGLILGEITQFFVKISRQTASMLSRSEFGPGAPSDYEWIGIHEKPSIIDTYYYRIEPRQDAIEVETSITKVVSALTARISLIETREGGTLWEKKIIRNFEILRLPDRRVETDAEVERLVNSIVNEVVDRLKPQESTAQRMIRVPHFGMTPAAAKWVRRGMQAAEQDNWPEAERLFLKGLEAAPNECTVYGYLGVAYEKNGRFLEAVAAYERAYRCRPRDPTYRYYSDDLQTAFAPNLSQQDLPAIVLGIRGDGSVYLTGGQNQSRPAGQKFTIYRTDINRGHKGTRIQVYKETDLARGRIIETNEQVSLGQLLLYNPELEVRRGDLVRFEGK